MPDLGLLRGAITIVTLLTFGGICWWAYRPENRERFEDDGLLAFGEDEARRMEQVQRDKASGSARRIFHDAPSDSDKRSSEDSTEESPS